jgi:hypothetical protein
MIRENRKFTHHFRGVYRICPNSIMEIRRLSICKPFGLANTRISTDCAQKSPRPLLSTPTPEALARSSESR